jgi:hypothetical protein
MAIIFASRGGGGGGDDDGIATTTSFSGSSSSTTPEPPGIHEVTIFFHDRLLRANRATKVNTHQLL